MAQNRNSQSSTDDHEVGLGPSGKHRLQEAIDGARQDPAVAFLVTLDAEEKLSTVRSTFKRVKRRVGASDVNLVTVASGVYIAQVPQRRGRRRKAA